MPAGSPARSVSSGTLLCIRNAISNCRTRAWVSGSPRSRAVISFRLNEVTKHHLDIPLGFAGGYFFLNKEAYAKLPAIARKAIDTYSGEPVAKKMGLGGLEINKEVMARLRSEPDRTLGTLAPQEMERWRKLLAPIAAEWVKTTPDGAKVLAAYEEEIRKIRAEKR